MYLFKTSGTTINSVIQNGRHAFASAPRDWSSGELVLVSKNKRDCRLSEKQIQFTMVLRDVRRIVPGEAERFWPGNEGRWNFLVLCDDVREILEPFDLQDVPGIDPNHYAPVVTFKRFDPNDERNMETYLRRVGAL